MADTKIEQKSNYEMFLECVNTLKNSQGFYSRLANDLNNMDKDQIEELKEYLNSLPQFKDQVDVVLFLEC